MTWSTTTDVHAFVDAAGPWLLARPVENTSLVTGVESARAGRATWHGGFRTMGWWTDAGQAEGAFLLSGEWLWVTRMPDEAATALVDLLPETIEVGGPVDTVEAIGRGWTARRADGSAEVAMRQRLYRLDQLAKPDDVAGSARAAGPDDREAVVAQRMAFELECLGRTGDPDRIGVVVDDLIGYGGTFLWVVGETAVSSAAMTRPVAGMARIGGVYTPPEHRRHGYGAAVVAAISMAAQAKGIEEIVLFTDLANPTSNSVYQRIGFTPVEDYLDMMLR
jgi:GNAT superfamily N-acetyltransferase